MNLHYTRIDPSGNITLLVTDSVPRQAQSDIARELMRRDPTAEQVGFVEKPTLSGAEARLQMMGGEFCGNATMSLAAYLAGQQGLPEGEARVFPLEISGAEGLIPCRISRSAASFTGTVPMPLPRQIARAEILPGVYAPLVRFHGISHIIIARNEITPEQADAKIAALCAELDADALGLLFTDAQFSCLRPLVYVRSTDSAVWENSCGSGTAAIGAYCAFNRGGEAKLEIRQPCPDTRIAVSAQCIGERVRQLEITGRVRVGDACILEV